MVSHYYCSQQKQLNGQYDLMQIHMDEGKGIGQYDLLQIHYWSIRRIDYWSIRIGQHDLLQIHMDEGKGDILCFLTGQVCICV